MKVNSDRYDKSSLCCYPTSRASLGKGFYHGVNRNISSLPHLSRDHKGENCKYLVQ